MTAGTPYRVVRSSRRKKTISVSRVHGEIVVSAPQHTPVAVIERLVPGLLSRLAAKEGAVVGDAELSARAADLVRRFLADQDLPSYSVSWTNRQQRRWGSCAAISGQIRVSDRLQGCPLWVLDYVLLHELVHLGHGNHGPEFQELLARYPQAAKAEGFLAGLEHAIRQGIGVSKSPDSA